MIITFRHKAFSLLELTVALVIVLIISVGVYPALNHYLIQSRVADAITATTPVQMMVTNQIASLGAVAGSGDGLDTPATLGKHVSGYSVASNGVISITTSAQAGSIGLTLTPMYDSSSEQVSWICAVDDAANNSSVPSMCRI